ncbi:MAG TPA: SNF2-related protein, partial [Ktedonobacterales bacterium]
MPSVQQGKPVVSSAGRSRRRVAAPAPPSTLNLPPTHVSFTDPHGLLAQLAAGDSEAVTYPDSAWYVARLLADQLSFASTFDKLLAPDALRERVRPHAFQIRVVEQVLREKAPSAILADEVGLGKTIEAGLIYKELALRGIVRSALVLAPKALLSQWQEELAERFGEDFVLTDEKRFRGFEAEERIICSLPQFVRSFERLAGRTWDLVIVDEAHLLANPASKRRTCVAELRSRWRLLLTATPLANKVTDLYSLIDLALPGRLGTQRQFEQEYVADPQTGRHVKPARAQELRSVTREVICRTRRAETEIAFAPRHVQTRSVAPMPAEDALISDVTDYLRALFRRGQASRANRGAVIREIMALQQSLSSSPRAIEQSLRRRAEKHADERGELLALAEGCRAVQSAKEQVLVDALRDLGDEPVLLFTLRLETAARLREVIRRGGRSAEAYTGDLKRAERESLVKRFNGGKLQTLIATDAGAEGLNLQERCSVVFNYDLHWNPMKIEQRIGRVQRLGQTRDVQVVNLVLQDTIDEYVVRLLYEKIDLFTMTIGALESVLSEVQEGELDLEERLLELLLASETRAQLRRDVAALGA